MIVSENIQKLLPFGYLYLVIMGILKESIYYYQIGVNILKYSTIMDILISPIALLAEYPIILVCMLLYNAAIYLYFKYVSKHTDKAWARKVLSIQNNENLSQTELKQHLQQSFIKFLALGTLAFFVGIGISTGEVLSKKIIKGNLDYKHTLTYDGGEVEQIFLINTNSLYCFYLTKESKNIKITPISAIKHLEFDKK